ncbi:MAG: helix-turn-helix domain-containing protein [Bacteroidetes bacterium]|nr:helix-turn-helix domain-containing protein [Bacteroidota bacterium]
MILSKVNTYKNYYSKQELSKELGISIRTIDNWLASGLISYTKIGRRVIFSKDDVDEFLARNKRDAYYFDDENNLKPIHEKPGALF